MKDTRYRSRKFIAAAVVIVLSSLFLYLEKLDGTQWIMAVEISLGLYVGANVSQKLKKGD
jgi:drug/metabolite transporter (DMT)-like permease